MDGVLSNEELAALRDAASVPLTPEREHGARPVALLGDTTAAHRLRPDGMRLANRWIALLRANLLRGFGVRTEMAAQDLRLVEPQAIRAEVLSSWRQPIEIVGRSLPALVAVDGAVVDGFASLLLGGPGEPGEGRQPSAASLGVFSHVGRMVWSSVCAAWGSELRRTARPIEGASSLCPRLFEARDLVELSVAMSHPVSGRIRLLAVPDVFDASPSTSLGTSSEAREQALALLSEVEVEVIVELGNATLTMQELGALGVGSVVPLMRSTGEPLPIRCGGVTKAFGRASATKGTMAVEVEAQAAAKWRTT